MRALFIPFTLSVFVAGAQPGADFYKFRDRCGSLQEDSLENSMDITGDSIPDLLVKIISAGTDDEPSSSGTCYLYLMNLPGTTLLNARDDHGSWRIAVCANGDSIPAAPTRAQDDQQIPKVLYTDGSVLVSTWGYGNQSAPSTFAPDLSAQHYVFRTISNGKLMHGSFSIDPLVWYDHRSVVVGALVPVDQPFVVR